MALHEIYTCDDDLLSILVHCHARHLMLPSLARFHHCDVAMQTGWLTGALPR